MITIAERIEVASSPDAVWKVLSDPEDVISCIGGADLTEHYDDGSFDTTLRVKFGGLRVSFIAHAILELDAEQMEGRLSARGKDRQGATRLTGEMRFLVEDADEHGSVITMGGEVELSGKLAPVIDAGAGVVVARMTREFSAALSARCDLDELSTQPPDAPAAVGVGSGDRLGSAPAGSPSVLGSRRSIRNRLSGLWASLLAVVRVSQRARRT